MPTDTPRTAWLAGATGLVGRALLARLQAAGRPLHLLLRRPPDGLALAATTQAHVVDFAALDAAALPPADDVFIALGTTIAVAGSQAAFRAVDHDAVLAVARAARQRGATRAGVVSALGADARSGVFYNRVKGEAEAALRAMGWPQLALAQPALLVGDRAALGQPPRALEAVSMRLLVPLAPLTPRRWRPIPADRVAQALVGALAAARPGVTVLDNATMLDD